MANCRRRLASSDTNPIKYEAWYIEDASSTITNLSPDRSHIVTTSNPSLGVTMLDRAGTTINLDILTHAQQCLTCSAPSAFRRKTVRAKAPQEGGRWWRDKCVSGSVRFSSEVFSREVYSSR